MSENQHQFWLVRWCLREGRPYDLIYAIPNGGSRNGAEAAKLKLGGVRAGIPDMCLPVARGGFHGLYIELKRIGGKASKEQKEWIEALRAEGYAAEVREGWEAAREVMVAYVEGRAF